jgi:hypothetical protein
MYHMGGGTGLQVFVGFFKNQSRAQESYTTGNCSRYSRCIPGHGRIQETESRIDTKETRSETDEAHGANAGGSIGIATFPSDDTSQQRGCHETATKVTFRTRKEEQSWKTNVPTGQVAIEHIGVLEFGQIRL